MAREAIHEQLNGRSTRKRQDSATDDQLVKSSFSNLPVADEEDISQSISLMDIRYNEGEQLFPRLACTRFGP